MTIDPHAVAKLVEAITGTTEDGRWIDSTTGKPGAAAERNEVSRQRYSIVKAAVEGFAATLWSARPAAQPRPTIAEIEAILAKDGGKVELLPNGEIAQDVGAGTEEPLAAAVRAVIADGAVPEAPVKALATIAESTEQVERTPNPEPLSWQRWSPPRSKNGARGPDPERVQTVVWSGDDAFPDVRLLGPESMQSISRGILMRDWFYVGESPWRLLAGEEWELARGPVRFVDIEIDEPTGAPVAVVESDGVASKMLLRQFIDEAQGDMGGEIDLEDLGTEAEDDILARLCTLGCSVGILTRNAGGLRTPKRIAGVTLLDSAGGAVPYGDEVERSVRHFWERATDDGVSLVAMGARWRWNHATMEWDCLSLAKLGANGYVFTEPSLDDRVWLFLQRFPTRYAIAGSRFGITDSEMESALARLYAAGRLGTGVRTNGYVSAGVGVIAIA